MIEMANEERWRRIAALEEEEMDLLDKYLVADDPETIRRLQDELAAIQCSMTVLRQGI